MNCCDAANAGWGQLPTSPEHVARAYAPWRASVALAASMTLQQQSRRYSQITMRTITSSLTTRTMSIAAEDGG